MELTTKTLTEWIQNVQDHISEIRSNEAMFYDCLNSQKEINEQLFLRSNAAGSKADLAVGLGVASLVMSGFSALLACTVAANS